MRKPVPYSIEVFDLICARIADGESLNSIVKQDDMPAYGTVMVWLDKDLDGAQEKYARARAIQADKLAEATIDIADGEGDVQRDRLRVDARKWFASKVAPKKYGDKVQTEVTGANGGAVQTETVVRFV